MSTPAQNQPESQGFQSSGSRAVVEVAVIVGVVALVIGGVIWLATRIAVWALPLVPASIDAHVGELAWAAMAPESRRCTDAAAKAYVDSLLQPLLAAMGDGAPELQVAVLDEEEPNAFALPGGFVAVHHGLLASAEDGAEVAAVLAHEIAHVTHRHGMQRLLRSAGASVIFSLFLGGADFGLLAGYAENLTHLAYDRDHEREADETGRATLVKARIPPAAMARFFTRLQERYGDSSAITTFLSSHPALAERVESAKQPVDLGGPPLDLPAPKGVPCGAAP